MKRKIYNPSTKNKTGGFIPRRDLFPDENITSIEKSSSNNIKRDEQKLMEQEDKKKPVSINANKNPKKHRKSNKSSSTDPALVILLLFGGLYLWPIFGSDKTGKTTDIQSAIQSAVYDVVDNPKAIKMLQAVCPYLGEREQDTIYTITGIQEVLVTVRDLINHSYQANRQSRALAAPLDPVEKRIEMIKVLKPYVPEVSRDSMENVIYVYETFNKLNKNIDRYNRKRKSNKGKDIGSIEYFTDIVELIMPVFSTDLQDKTARIINLMKMAESMESSGVNDNRKTEATSIKKPHPKADVKEKKEKLNEQNPSKKNVSDEDPSQTEKIKRTLEPMLEAEQKGSLDMIMKMAQLLAAPDKENNSKE